MVWPISWSSLSNGNVGLHNASKCDKNLVNNERSSPIERCVITQTVFPRYNLLQRLPSKIFSLFLLWFASGYAVLIGIQLFLDSSIVDQVSRLEETLAPKGFKQRSRFSMTVAGPRLHFVARSEMKIFIIFSKKKKSHFYTGQWGWIQPPWRWYVPYIELIAKHVLKRIIDAVIDHRPHGVFWLLGSRFSHKPFSLVLGRLISLAFHESSTYIKKEQDQPRISVASWKVFLRRISPADFQRYTYFLFVVYQGHGCRQSHTTDRIFLSFLSFYVSFGPSMIGPWLIHYPTAVMTSLAGIWQ